MQSTHSPVPDMGQAIMPDRYIINCCRCAAEHQSLASIASAFAVGQSETHQCKCKCRCKRKCKCKCKCRGRVLQSGLLEGTALTNLHSSGAQPIDLLKSELTVSAPSRSHAAHESSASSLAADSSAVAEYADAQLRAENEILKWQLAQTKEIVVQWQQLHGELHAFCVDKVLKTART